jgi:DNA-binding NtrC family response regulator
MPEERRRPCVFVVDDESVIAFSLATILCRSGFDAKPFTEPLIALKAARSEAPDLLISDVVMPILSGFDLAVQIQEFCPNCKVLMFSGQAATADLLDKSRANGHDFEFLLKPVHPQDLLNKIRDITKDRDPLPPFQS